MLRELVLGQMATSRQLELVLAGQRTAVSSPLTPAQLAHVVLEALGRITDGVVTVAPRDGAPAILSAALQAALGACSSEAAVVRFMTPILARLRLPAPDAAYDVCRPVLVNSELLPWLVPPAAVGRWNLRMQPDLFVSWEPFVEFRDSGAAAASQGGASSELSFGVLADHALQRAQCVTEFYEAKRGALTDGDFGDNCGYHQCVSGLCRSMLFGSTGFWLYESVGGHPMRLLKSAWTDGGSADLVRTFFSTGAVEPPLVGLLRSLLTDLAVVATHVDPDSRRSDSTAGRRRRCHLGSGGSGHVFVVAAGAGGGAPLRALKAVLTSRPAVVAREFGLMRAAAERGAPVVRPVPDSLRVYGAAGDASGGGYLLESVGTAFAVTSRGRCAEAFEALAALHASGIVHGDPRVPNLLLTHAAPASRCAWIDLCTATTPDTPAAMAELQRDDARVLARSVLVACDAMPRDDTAAAPAAPLPAAVVAAIARFDPADVASVHGLADAVATVCSL